MTQHTMRHKLHHPSCRLSLAFCCVSTSPHVPLCVRFVYVRLVHGPCSVMCPLRVCPLSPRPSFHYAFSLIPTTYRNYSHVHTGSTNYEIASPVIACVSGVWRVSVRKCVARVRARFQNVVACILTMSSRTPARGDIAKPQQMHARLISKPTRTPAATLPTRVATRARSQRVRGRTR